MATETTNFKLKKPDRTDFVNVVEQVNDNLDIIDTEIKVAQDSATGAYKQDSKNNTVSFTEATTDSDIASGDTHATLFSKLSKRLHVIKDTLLTKLDIGKDYRPNLLANGDFQVWQRGETFVADTSKYTADRWYFSGATGDSSISIAKVDSGAKIITSATNSIYLMQTIENSSYLFGKSITISCSINGVVYKLSGTVSVTNLILNIPNVGLFYTEFNGSTKLLKVVFLITTNRNVIINWVKLEVNDHATPFIPKSYAEELALCQRYYFPLKGYTLKQFTMDDSNLWCFLTTPNMRAIPTLITGAYGTDWQVYGNVNAPQSGYSINMYSSTKNNVVFIFNKASHGMTMYSFYVSILTDKFALDAEI